MGLEQVKQNILAEGRAQAEQELAKARAEAQAIKQRAEQRAQEIRSEAQRKLEAAAQGLKRRELALAELEAKKLRLQAEKELLGRVRAQASERLARLPAKQNEEYLQTLIQRAPIQDPRYWTKPEDKATIERLGLKYAGSVQAIGGVIVESAEGTTREDLRYENLLDEAWRDALGEVAGQLFGTQGRRVEAVSGQPSPQARGKEESAAGTRGVR